MYLIVILYVSNSLMLKFLILRIFETQKFCQFKKKSDFCTRFSREENTHK